MSKTTDLPYYTINSTALAKWLIEQPDNWWNVDGDPLLTSLVDFPCPSDEIASALTKVAGTIRIFDSRDEAKAHGEEIAAEQLDALADTANNSHARTFLLRWDDSDVQWLLAEDPDAANDAA